MATLLIAIGSGRYLKMPYLPEVAPPKKRASLKKKGIFGGRRIQKIAVALTEASTAKLSGLA